MSNDSVQIRVKGKTFAVPSIEVASRTIAVTGRWIKTAAIKDEGVVEGEIVANPELFISRLANWEERPDIFTFGQKLPEVTPKFAYYFESDNVAAITIDSFESWWEKLPQESRKNVRRSAKRGVVVRSAEFDDDFARGIHKIYSETPVRQGRRFWHFGKDFETVKREHATYLERSEFIGAYHGDELIGFIKMVYVDQVATLFHIFAKERHHDKRPMNALVAKAVEICAAKGMRHLVYGRFTYGKKTDSPLAEFKRRNGFEQIDFPRYYIPLTFKGKVALRLRLHRGLSSLLPQSLLLLLISLRARFFAILGHLLRRKATAMSVDTRTPPAGEAADRAAGQ